jgi:hypothetical protein
MIKSVRFRSALPAPGSVYHLHLPPGTPGTTLGSSRSPFPVQGTGGQLVHWIMTACPILWEMAESVLGRKGPLRSGHWPMGH